MIVSKNKKVYRVCWLIDGEIERNEHDNVEDALEEFMEFAHTSEAHIELALEEVNIMLWNEN